MPDPIRIIFFGTPEFAIPALEALKSNGYAIVAVVTAPDARVGRKQILTPPPVKIWAEKNNIPMLQPETLKNLEFRILDLGFELGVVVAYGKIIPAEILMIPKYGFLNVHPSLLPKYRGPTPMQNAILNGETETGVTIHLTTQNLDAGPIVAQKELRIKKDESCEELSERLSKLGAELLIGTIPGWIAGSIEPKEQDASEATYTKKFTREDGRINWNKSCGEILRRIRALNPEPGTYTELGIKNKELRIIKIIQASLLDTKSPPKIEFFEHNKKLAHACKDGVLILETVQPAGAKIMSSEEFLRGHRWIVAQ